MTDPLDRLNAALADRYTIEREIGSGGMATVYLAHDRKHDRHVALKVMRPALSAVVGSERFLREIHTMARLSHPHIVALHDSGQCEGLVYYVMPHLEGESFNRLEITERFLQRPGLYHHIFIPDHLVERQLIVIDLKSALLVWN